MRCAVHRAQPEAGKWQKLQNIVGMQDKLEKAAQLFGRELGDCLEDKTGAMLIAKSWTDVVAFIVGSMLFEKLKAQRQSSQSTTKTCAVAGVSVGRMVFQIIVACTVACRRQLVLMTQLGPALDHWR